MCGLCPGQIPKLSVPCFSRVQDLMKGGWELEVCAGKQIYLTGLNPLDPELFEAGLNDGLPCARSGKVLLKLPAEIIPHCPSNSIHTRRNKRRITIA